jgi:hypothetical protein
VTGAIDPRLAAESLIPPRTGISITPRTSNLDRELMIRLEIGRVVLMSGLRQIDQVPDRIADSP